MAPHSSTLAWKIPWMEKPGGLQSMGSIRVGHDWATSLSLFTFMHWRRKWWPTPVFLPGESQGPGSLVGCRLWGRTESDTTEATWQQQVWFGSRQPVSGSGGDLCHSPWTDRMALSTSWGPFFSLDWLSLFPGRQLGFPCSSPQWRICLQCRRHGFDSWVGKIPWRRKWQPTPVFLPGESHGQGAWQVTVDGVARVGHNWATKHGTAPGGQELGPCS